MIVRRFLLWARHAPAGQRAEAVGALARAFLAGDLAPADLAEAELALTAMLEDGSPLVRRTMAEALAEAPHAPRHLIVALAGDAGEVALPILARSPVLEDCDLVDCAAIGDARAQEAVAGRATVSVAVSAALAEIGCLPALLALARNPGSEITDISFARMVERHGASGELREALLARPDVPVETIQAIAAALSEALGGFVTRCGWMSGERSARVTREAKERATVSLSSRAGAADLARLVLHLRHSGQLTPVLILRALLSCRIDFAEAALADLARVPLRRVSAILHDRNGAGFRGLYERTGLPASLRPAFEAAASALREASSDADRAGASLSRRMVERALTACDALGSEDSSRILALLRRFEVEAAIDEARCTADEMADHAALLLVLEHAPDALVVDSDARRIAA